MAKQKISNLPSAATLTGAEVVVVNQGGVTKRSTVTSVQTIPLAAAAAAQSTADGKLSTVAVDGTTITGDGTVGNPLVAGGGVVFTSMKNDVGNIVWAVVGNGELQGTLSNAFLASKFYGISGSMNGGNVPYITITKRIFDSIVGVDIFKFDGTRSGTPFGSFFIHLIINN
jgi:hypothetical protein